MENKDIKLKAQRRDFFTAEQKYSPEDCLETYSNTAVLWPFTWEKKLWKKSKKK